MIDESHNLLDQLLEAWHKWAQGYQYVAGIGSSPMFRHAKTSRGWDTVDEILDEEIDIGKLEAVNFHINELAPLYRTALQLQARNLATGFSVWRSVRLPSDTAMRVAILQAARTDLIERLIDAGVM